MQIIKAYLNETADLIAEKDLQIHLDILPSAFINGNKMLVEKVFSNLIGNAIKYSPQRADIWISVLMKHEQIVFSVENAGCIYQKIVFPDCLMRSIAWSSQEAERLEEVDLDCILCRKYYTSMEVNVRFAIRKLG